jgi:DNA-directed RNA polymerase sigma subunit (sigma70/sigma32)
VLAHWGELDDQSQLLLTLRFYGNMTQDEIGKRLGGSQMQVSRLLRRALAYLRERLTCPPRTASGRTQWRKHSGVAAGSLMTAVRSIA